MIIRTAMVNIRMIHFQHACHLRHDHHRHYHIIIIIIINITLIAIIIIGTITVTTSSRSACASASDSLIVIISCHYPSQSRRILFKPQALNRLRRSFKMSWMPAFFCFGSGRDSGPRRLLPIRSCRGKQWREERYAII